MATLQISLIIFLSFYRCNAQVNQRYYPRYHLAPPYGWMNDPNGFCYFKNEYHLFYQYNPNSSLVPGIAHWGHAKSSDLVHWKHLPIAMYPDQSFDKTGVFSGSAIVENDTMYLYYTGNVNHPGKTPDHIQRQALAVSTDGVTFTKYKSNPIIIEDKHQPNLRDPKVWEHDGTYYMVLGNSFNNDSLGRVLLYTSEDKINWQQVSILDKSDGFLGFMWECPDFFKLNDHFVLLFSPQGMKAEGSKYRNLYQTGYIVGNFNYSSKQFKPITKFRELDHGHDFYATQSVLDKKGRRVVVAWLDMWDQNYPEGPDGFTGQMTIVRQLSLTKDGHLIQTPLPEMKSARGKILCRGRASGGTTVFLEDNAAEISLIVKRNNSLELNIEPENSLSDGQNRTSVKILYDAQSRTLTLDRGGPDGIRSTAWHPKKIVKMRIYVDASSVELFAGDGEVTFSSRFFPDGNLQVRLGDKSVAEYLQITQLKPTVSFD